MISILCDWGGDLSVGPGGDINVAPPEVELPQRICRRLLTNSGDYIWHTGYGAGLGSYVGKPYSQGAVESTILSHLQFEQLVNRNPAPTVIAADSASGAFSVVSVTVNYSTPGSSVENSLMLGLNN